MTPQERLSYLLATIESDQSASLSYEAGNDNETAKRLSEIVPMVARLVPNVDIKRHAILNGYWPSVMIASEAMNANLQVRSLAISVAAWVNDVSATTDFSFPEVQAMMNGLVASGLMTAGQMTSLIALASVPQVIAPNDISAVRGI